MGHNEETPGNRPVKDAHKTLGLWSIRRALTLAFTGAAVLLVAAWFLVTWLLGSPPVAKPKPLETKDQLELLKFVFALVAGVGALVALVTAYRRQRVDEAAGERAERAQAHAERVQAHAEHDAAERRVTDLYGQAVEQLGHDKAAVRLGGLYSLERLAQDHPEHRQTVTDVVCSYLRMPFQPPPATDAQPEQPEDNTPSAPAAADAARQEVQVRLAAQRLIKRHLTTTPLDQPQRRPSTYWDGIDIDLTGAHLVDFDFTQCRSTNAVFDNARFSGDAGFDGAQFNGDAGFDEAQFNGDAGFNGARFNGYARFREARFSGYAWFDEAQFNGGARFRKAQFRSGARFRKAQFSGDVWFGGAQFKGDARFGGHARSDKAQFEREPDFDRATASHPNVNHVWPSSWHAQVVDDDTPDGMARLTRED
ncbi:pentapeptide repeat-containing protein [Actinomadura sp. NTSP31]|uniref:pentapeptide repeat-containing protein n=1 Tax=Actinomadura sp. NTSP31 TaxID=1735447 RepID=UPI0035C0558D